MLPAMVAAFASSFTAKVLGLPKFVVKFEDPLTYNVKTVTKLIVIAILFGIVLALLYLLLYKGRYCGLGTNLTMASFYGGTIYRYDFLLKAGLTILTLAAGFQGGEIAPIFLGIEMFGANHAVLFTVICIIAFQWNGNRTIYGKQRVSQMLDFKEPRKEKKKDTEVIEKTEKKYQKESDRKESGGTCLNS